MTQINNDLANSSTATASPKYWVVSNKTANTFRLTRRDGSAANGKNLGNYSSAGTIHCLVLGWEYQFFTDAFGGTDVFQISTCVSERIGAEAYTDAIPIWPESASTSTPRRPRT